MSKNRLLICSALLMFGFIFSAKAQVRIIQTVAGTGSGTTSGDNGQATAAGVSGPYGIFLDGSNNLFIAEQGGSGSGNRIRRVDAVTGIITTVAGNGGFSLNDNGPATAASVNSPSDVTLDAAGNIYVTQNSTSFGSDCRIRKITVSTGIITTIGGNGTNSTTGDGTLATTATVASPRGIVLDAAGNVYFTESNGSSSNRVRMINVTTGIISTIAGANATGSTGDGGPATAAFLNSPRGLGIDAAGNLYVADMGNNRIREITLPGGIISTVVGNTSGFSGDGSPAISALLNAPTDVFFDIAGNMFIADASNNRIRMVNTSGIISTVAGTTGTGGYSGDGGLATTSKLNGPVSMAVTPGGKIYISDRSNNRIRLIKNNDSVSFRRTSRQNISVCENSPANSLSAALAIVDSDYSQTETWTQIVTPINGTITSSAFATSNGGILTPTTLTYTPNLSFSGPDSFIYSVSDGIVTVFDTVIVNVIALPSPGTITGPTSVCVGASITLSDGVAGGTWTPNNFNATIGSANGVVNGASAGTTIMTYTVGNTCQTVTATYTTTINPLPNAGSVFGPTTVCLGATITLSDVAPGGSWISSNTSLATVAAGVVRGVLNGAVPINYSVTNICGTAVATSTVNVISVIPPGTIIGLSSVCQGSTITLTDANLGGVWSPSNTNAFVSSGIVTGLSAGPVTISYSFTNLCGTTNAVLPVTINPLPDAGVITGPGSVCLAATITVADATSGGTWSAVTGGTSITGGGVVTGIFGGFDTVKYSVTNVCGTDIAAYPVNVISVPSAGTITGPVSTCEGSVIGLSDVITGGVWSVTNSFAAISAGGLVSGISSGIDTILYTVTYTCGSDVASFPVTINPLANAGAITGASNACPGATITLTNATTGGTWSSTSAAATISATGLVTGVSPGTTIISYNLTNMCGTAFTTKTITVNPILITSLTTAASPGNSLCDVTSPVTFTPAPVNGGSLPAYMWYVNGIPSSSAAIFTYSPADGDVVKCLLTSNALCAIPDTASANITMTITPLRVPSATINVSPNDTVCTPSVVAYSVSPVNGGTTPIYQWNKNGINVGTGPIYGTVPANGDLVYCTLTSNLWCISATTATSNTIIMRLETPTANTISITATKSAIFIGAVDTFIVVAPHAGSSPVYQWIINGVPVPGANSPIYITDSLKPGQAVACSVASDDICVVPHMVTSAVIRVLVATGVNELTTNNGFTVMPNPNKGSFTIKGSIGTLNEDVSLEITNMIGQVVYSAVVPVQNGMLDKQIAIGNELANGLYLLHITNGGTPTVIRFTVGR